MPEDSALKQAITELQELGLTEYEAKCFVAVSRVPSGTAKEISELTDVPRSRIYDVTESLHEQGVVEILEGTPREFRAVSPDLAVRKLEREFRDHLDAVSEAMEMITTAQDTETDSGVWKIQGQENVIERGQQIAADSDEELFGLFTEDTVFTEDCFQQAHDAIERGVTVILGSPDEGLREELRAEFPEARIWEPNLEWQTVSMTEGQVSRLVMADRDEIMIATLEEQMGSGGHREDAIWGWGETNGLLLVMRRIIGTHLDEFESTGDTARIPL